MVNLAKTNYTIEHIKESIDREIINGELDLAQCKPLEKLSSIIRAGISLDKVNLREAFSGVSSDGQDIIINGLIEIDGNDSVDVKIIISIEKKLIEAEIALSFIESFNWRHIGLPFDFEINSLTFKTINNERLCIGISAKVSRNAGSIEFDIEVPDQDGFWSFSLDTEKETVSLDDIINIIAITDFRELLPIALNNVLVTNLDFRYKPSIGINYAEVGIVVETELPLIANASLKRIMANVYMEGDVAERVVNINLSGLLSLTDTTQMLLSGHRLRSTDTRWKYEGRLYELRLTELLAALSNCFEMPVFENMPLLPDIKFNEIAAEIEPLKGVFSFSANLSSSNIVLCENKLELPASKVVFCISRQALAGHTSYQLSAEFSAKYTKAQEIISGISVNNYKFTYTNNASVWSVGGNININILDKNSVELSVGYSKDKVNKLHRLNLCSVQRTSKNEAKEIDVITVKKGVSLSASNISLLLTAEKKEKGGYNKDFTFSASANFRIKVDKEQSIDIEGNLRAGELSEGKSDEKGRGLKFSIKSSQPLPIKLPQVMSKAIDLDPVANIHSAAIGIIRGEDKKWRLEGSCKASLTGFPALIQTVLPAEEQKSRISISNNELKISINKVFGGIPVLVPELPLSKKKLNNLLVDINELAIHVDFKSGIYLSFNPSITLPDNINEVMFGKTEDKKVRKVFTVQTPIEGKFSVGVIEKSVSASFSVTQLPFKSFAINTDDKTNREYWNWGFGEAGCIKIDVPEFNASATGAFTFRGGFKQDEKNKLGIPLAPIKALLGDNLKQISEFLPDKIPLLPQKPKLFSNGEMIGDGLIEYIELMGSYVDPDFSLPGFMKKGIEDIAKTVAGLPERLIDYLEAEIPDELHFEVNVDASGSLTFDVDIGANGLWLLLPCQPNLMGIKIQKVSFGPVLGGSLFLLKLTADIDVFNLPALAASVAAANNRTAEKIFPDSKAYCQTTIIDELSMFIVYQTGVPIPIPLFYKELAVKSHDPTGLAVRAGVSFYPEMEDFMQVLASVGYYYDFITKPSFHLPDDGPIKIHTDITETYFQLPAFFGKEKYGSEEKNLLEVDPYKLFVHAMNGIKFFSITEMIKSIPLEYRCRDIELNFGPLEFSTIFVATTRKEFKDGLTWASSKTKRKNRLIGLDKKGKEDFLALVPTPTVSHNEADSREGIIFALEGVTSLSSVIKYQGQFALITAEGSGFSAGVNIKTTLLNSLTCQITGTVAVYITDSEIEKKAEANGFSGTGVLSDNNGDIVSGAITLKTNEISFKSQADLFPGITALTLNGYVCVSLKEKDFNAHGLADIDLFNAVKVTDKFCITHELFRLKTNLKLFGGNEIAIEITTGTFARSTIGKMKVSASFKANLQQAVYRQAIAEAQIVLQSSISKNLKWAKDMQKKEKAIYKVTWSPYIIFYTALLKGQEITTWLTDGMSRFTEPVKRGIHWQRDKKGPLFDSQISVRFESDLDICQLNESIKLNVSGKYAGIAFNNLQIDMRLDGKTLASELGKAIVRRVVG